MNRVEVDDELLSWSPLEPLREAVREDVRTQAEIADALGVTPQHMSLFIRGRSGLSEPTAARLAQVLGRRPRPLAVLAAAHVRLCCGQPARDHNGPVCPDGRVMCELCFTRVHIADLSIDPVDSSPVAVCARCAADEAAGRPISLPPEDEEILAREAEEATADA